MPHRILMGVMVGVLASVRPVSSQRPGVPVTVRGVAYDSVRRLPLGDAFITLGGGARTTTTDSRGRFRFDNVAPGDYTFGMLHPGLDSLGFSGIATRASVTDGRAEVRITTPSFSTLWRAACGSKPAHPDSGFVYGTVRDAATLVPVANAVIDVSWTDFLIATKHFEQRNWSGESRSDSSGNYALCGVPFDVALRVHATSGSTSSGRIELPPPTARVVRRDLLVGPNAPSDSLRLGTIAGALTDLSGAPFVGVAVTVDDLPEVRSGADGHFTIPNVGAGTRQINFRSIGMTPVSTIVDVVARDTTRADLQVGQVQTLQTVRTMAAAAARQFAAEFELRRKVGGGHMMDSTTIATHENFVNVLREIPSLHVVFRSNTLTITVPDGRGGNCEPDVKIDGAPAAFGHLADLFPKEVAAIEVYPHANTVPMKFAPPGIRPLCGMILVWTKYGFINR